MGSLKWNSPSEVSNRFIPAAEFSEAPERSSPEFGLRSFLGVIRRQAKLILAVVFVICTATLLALLQIPPIYSAQALLIVDSRQQSALDPEGQMSILPNDQGRVESEVEILKAPSTFLNVVKELKLYQDPEFAPTQGWLDYFNAMVGLEDPPPTSEEVLKLTLESLQEATSISRVGATYLIAVTVDSTDPAKAANIANALANAYVSEQVGAKVAIAVDIQGALARRLGEASVTLRAAEENLDTFIAENIDSVADDASRRSLSDLRNRIATRAAETQRLSDVVSASRDDLAGRDWNSLVGEIDSESLKALNQRRAGLVQAISQAAGSEQAVNLRESLASLDAEMEGEARSAIDRTADILDSSKASEVSLRQELRERIVESELPKDMLVKLYEVQQAATVSRTVYQELLNRSKVFESQKTVQLPDSRVVSLAMPPSDPSFPKKSLFLSIAGVLSLMLGLGLAFLRENYVGGFVSEAQAEQVLGVRVVSSLPRLSAGDAVAAAAEVVRNPLSPYSEAIRRARLAFELGTGANAQPLRTIMITSALPGEGKTQTAVSIARSLALAGRKTLLVDCDLRRPSVHKALGIDPDRGLTEGLLGEASFKDIVVKDGLTDLMVVCGLKSSHGATDLLIEGARFNAMLSEARESFDYIILDASPVLPVVDPRLLLRYAGAVLNVVRWASTAQFEVGAAIADLERANGRGVPIFAALNRAEVSASGYGSARRYYGTYN